MSAAAAAAELEKLAKQKAHEALANAKAREGQLNAARRSPAAIGAVPYQEDGSPYAWQTRQAIIQAVDLCDTLAGLGLVGEAEDVAASLGTLVEVHRETIVAHARARLQRRLELASLAEAERAAGAVMGIELDPPYGVTEPAPVTLKRVDRQ